MSETRQESKLIRNLGFWDLMGIAIGQIIGVGIMSSTGVAIGMTGTGVVLVYLLRSKAPYNWSLCFQQFPSKKEEGEAHSQILAWLRAGAIRLKDFISDYVAFEDVIEAFDKVQRREIALKCIVRYE